MKKLGMLILMCFILISFCVSSYAEEITFKTVNDTELQIRPKDLDSIDDNIFVFIENIDGDEKQILAPFYVANPKLSTPYVKLENGYILTAYTLHRSLGADVSFYKIGSKQLIGYETDEIYLSGSNFEKEAERELPEQETQLFNFYNPVNNLFITGTNCNDMAIGDVDTPFWFNFFETDENNKCDQFAWISNHDISLMEQSGIMCKLKEEYEKVYAAANEKYIYFDNFTEDKEPQIMFAEINEDVNPYYGYDNAPVYRNNAMNPKVSADNTVFAYDKNGKSGKQTVIEKNGKEVISFNSEKIILMDDYDKEVYVIDEQASKLEIYNMDSLKIQKTANIDSNFIFPYFQQGKLQYSCPLYENGKIVDYITKTETVITDNNDKPNTNPDTSDKMIIFYLLSIVISGVVITVFCCVRKSKTRY